MKKIYILALAAIFGATSVFAQSNPRKKTSAAARTLVAKYDKKYLTGFEKDAAEQPEVPLSAFARGIGKSIGLTNYDLQTNGTMKPRILNLGGGKVAASYTYGTGDVDGGFTDRGTGYNTNVSGAFLPQPSKRIETVRAGFTNLCIDAEGTEYAFAHTTSATGFKVLMNKKLKGATTWKQTDVPSGIPTGELWPSAAIGGANGKTVHLVATTDQPYKGMTRGMLYFRSQDGGVTWDKKNISLPGADSLNYIVMNADAYSIASKGNTVAVAYFGGWEDTNVWISQDNGNTWTKRTAYNFPLDLYKNDDGYDVTKFPATDEHGEGFIFTGDGAGSIFFDKNGKVNIMFGKSFVGDLDLGDQNSSYLPLANDLVLWNETYKKDSLNIISAWPDQIKDDSLTLGGGSIGTYFNSATSWPATTVGPDGTIYVVYTAPDEKRPNGEKDLNRGVFVMFSKNDGKTWSKPFDLIGNKKYFNPNIDLDLDIAECTFPSVASVIDNGKLHIVYQIDDSHRLHLQGTATNPVPATDNLIYYVDVDIADVLTATEEVVTPATFDFAISPNPAHDQILLSYNLKDASEVKVTLTDLTGRVVNSAKLGRQTAGATTYNMNVDAAAGLYFVQLNINGQIATQKVVIK